MFIPSSGNGAIYVEYTFGLGQDIMGVYYNGGELSENALEIVEVLSQSDMANCVYSPYWAISSDLLDVTKGEFIKTYIETFIRNPIMMARCIICRMDVAWDIFCGENAVIGSVAYTGTRDSEKEKWANLWGEREYNFITQRVLEWVTYSVDKPVLSVIDWRSGIWFLLSMIAMGVCVYKGILKRTFLLFVPCLSHVLSLMLSTGWSEFRYFWSINLMALFIFTTVMTLKPKESVK